MIRCLGSNRQEVTAKGEGEREMSMTLDMLPRSKPFSQKEREAGEAEEDRGES